MATGRQCDMCGGSLLPGGSAKAKDRALSLLGHLPPNNKQHVKVQTEDEQDMRYAPWNKRGIERDTFMTSVFGIDVHICNDCVRSPRRTIKPGKSCEAFVKGEWIGVICVEKVGKSGHAIWRVSTSGGAELQLPQNYLRDRGAEAAQHLRICAGFTVFNWNCCRDVGNPTGTYIKPEETEAAMARFFGAMIAEHGDRIPTEQLLPPTPFCAPRMDGRVFKGYIKKCTPETRPPCGIMLCKANKKWDSASNTTNIAWWAHTAVSRAAARGVFPPLPAEPPLPGPGGGELYEPWTELDEGAEGNTDGASAFDLPPLTLARKAGHTDQFEPSLKRARTSLPHFILSMVGLISIAALRMNLPQDTSVVGSARMLMHEWVPPAVSELLDHHDFVLWALKHKQLETLHLAGGISQTLYAQESFVNNATRYEHNLLQYASEELRSNQAVVLEAVKQDGWALRYASEELRSNQAVVLEAVKQNARALGLAPEELRSNQAVVLEAVKQDGWALQFASEELRSNEAVVLEAVKQNGWALGYASEELRSNQAIVLEAVKQDRSALEFSSEELRSNETVVLEAMRPYCQRLKYASEELRSNETVMLGAVKQGGSALKYASEELRSNETVVLEAMRPHCRRLKFASEELRSNETVMLGAVKEHGSALKYASEELRSNQAVVLEAVKQRGLALQFASEELRSNQAVVLEAVKQDGLALEFSSEELRSNQAVVLEAVKQGGWALKYASEELRSNQAVVLEAVEQDGWALKYASEELRSNETVVLEAVKQDGWALKFASEELRSNEAFVLEAVKQNGSALQFASEELRTDEDFRADVMHVCGRRLLSLACVQGDAPPLVADYCITEWQPD